MNSLKTFSFILDLLGIGEIAQGEATIIEGTTALLVTTSAQLIKVGHGVALRHFVLAELIQVRLDQRAILAALAALVIKTGRNSRLLLRERCIVRIKLVRRGVLAAPWLLRGVIADCTGILHTRFLLLFGWFDLLPDENKGHLSQLAGQSRCLLRVRQSLLMLIKLGEHGAELEHESAIVARQVDGALEDLARWPTSLSLYCIAIEPVLGKHELDFLRAFLVVVSNVSAVWREVVLIDNDCLRLARLGVLHAFLIITRKVGHSNFVLSGLGC